MINAAVIGLGRWGKSLVTAVQGKTPKLRFVHGVSKEPDDVRAFATQHGFRLSTELDEAIANPEVQAVFLATPHSLHVEQVRAVARAGKPAVRLVPVEPPVTLSRRERWDALRAELKARGQEIWIAPDIEEVEAQIAAEMNGDFEDDDGAPR